MIGRDVLAREGIVLATACSGLGTEGWHSLSKYSQGYIFLLVTIDLSLIKVDVDIEATKHFEVKALNMKEQKTQQYLTLVLLIFE